MKDLMNQFWNYRNVVQFEISSRSESSRELSLPKNIGGRPEAFIEPCETSKMKLFAKQLTAFSL